MKPAWLLALIAPAAIAAGDVSRGAKAFGQCMACHSVQPGEHQTLAAQEIDAPPSAFRPNEGIVRGIEKATGEIIIRHGPLPEMDMPPMTMAFEVKDAGLLDKAKAGDRVRFRVELQNGRFTVTEIEVVGN